MVVSFVVPVICASGNKTDVCAPPCKTKNAKCKRNSVRRDAILNFRFFILSDGGNCESVTDAHVRAGMLRIKNALNGAQDDVSEGERDGAFGQDERALLIEATVFGEEPGKGCLIIRVGFGAAKNEFTTDVSACE